MESPPKVSDLDITLFRGWKENGVYVWSPFVTKLELRLRLAGIKYTTQAGNPRTAPTGKIPYVSIASKTDPSSPPLQIGDSSLIAQYFTAAGLMQDLTASLNETEKTVDLAMQALFEDKLYFFNMRERWIENFYVQRDQVLGDAPWLVRWLIGGMIYRSHVKTLHGQGTGRFSVQEARGFREEIWVRLNGMLAESRKKQSSRPNECFWCLGGDGPTSCDSTVFGFVSSALIADR
jgi:Glutathione S-transferase N-terminal domain